MRREILLKKSRFTEQQIVYAIKQVEVGVPIVELCRKYGISQQTFHLVPRLED